MTVEVYGPNHLSPSESLELHQAESKVADSLHVSDEVLSKYVKEYFSSFRSTVEEFFPEVSGAIDMYANSPFHSFVVRLGPHGVMIGHRKSSESIVEVRRFQDFDPPFASPNIFDIGKQLQCERFYVSFQPRSFDANEAHAEAASAAVSAVLHFFWSSIASPTDFESLVVRLMLAEGVTCSTSTTEPKGDFGIDARAKVLLREPADFRRFEEWAFQFKHKRVAASDVRKCEAHAAQDSALDCICLVTSDDLTSIGRYVASESTRVRVWDRSVLNRLVHKHPAILRSHFKEFPDAVEELSRRLASRASAENTPRTKEFEQRLSTCPPGQEHFAAYEEIGIEILGFLFGEHLGPAKPQSRTLDGKQRRDVLFRNNRTNRFFDRCFHRFASDSIIVDFKNYGEAIASSVITDVDKYANKALGRLILVVSRKGAESSAEGAQIRCFRDSNVVVLVLSDVDLLEMTQRKEKEQAPEDVVEDKLDELLRKY